MLLIRFAEKRRKGSNFYITNNLFMEKLCVCDIILAVTRIVCNFACLKVLNDYDCETHTCVAAHRVSRQRQNHFAQPYIEQSP